MTLLTICKITRQRAYGGGNWIQDTWPYYTCNFFSDTPTLELPWRALLVYPLKSLLRLVPKLLYGFIRSTCTVKPLLTRYKILTILLMFLSCIWVWRFLQHGFSLSLGLSISKVWISFLFMTLFHLVTWKFNLLWCSSLDDFNVMHETSVKWHLVKRKRTERPTG